MDGGRRFERNDGLMAAIVFAVALVLRAPFRSHYAYHWDSAQYALAIGNYNIGRSQPQAPGSFLYVMLGRLVNLFFGDAHASLVWMSMVAGAALVALGFLLATSMFGRGCGWATAAILATSPLCWFLSEVALTNIVDGALVTATMLVGWRAIGRGGTGCDIVSLSCLMAVTAGVRQQTGPVLLPAWFYVFSQFAGERWKKLCLGLALLAVFSLAWFIPLVTLSGGLENYWHCLQAKAAYDAPATPWNGGWAALKTNLTVVVHACWAGLLGAAVIAGVEGVRAVLLAPDEQKQRFRANHAQALRLLAFWILPMVGFNLLTYMSMPGYVMNYFPGVAIVAGLLIWKFTTRPIGPVGRSITVAIVVAGVVLLNGLIFLVQPPGTKGLLKGFALTRQSLRDNDQQLKIWTELVRAKFKPDEVMICFVDEPFQFGFRHFQYHLSEYRQVLLTPDSSLPGERANQFWVGQGDRTEFSGEFKPEPATTILLFVSPGQQLGLFAPFFDLSAAREVAGSAGALFTLPVTAVKR